MLLCPPGSDSAERLSPPSSGRARCPQSRLGLRPRPSRSHHEHPHPPHPPPHPPLPPPPAPLLLAARKSPCSPERRQEYLLPRGLRLRPASPGQEPTAKSSSVERLDLASSKAGRSGHETSLKDGSTTWSRHPHGYPDHDHASPAVWVAAIATSEEWNLTARRGTTRSDKQPGTDTEWRTLARHAHAMVRHRIHPRDGTGSTQLTGLVPRQRPPCWMPTDQGKCDFKRPSRSARSPGGTWIPSVRSSRQRIQRRSRTMSARVGTGTRPGRSSWTRDSLTTKNESICRRLRHLRPLSGPWITEILDNLVSGPGMR